MQGTFGADVVARQLVAEGIDTIFTLTGGHISALYEGICRVGGIRIVDVRHEQAAAHAADAYSRLTGKPGCAIVTAGPGMTGTLTGLANAYYAGSSLVVICGSNPVGFDGMGTLQDAPHVQMAAPVTKWAERIVEPKRIAGQLSQAITAALTPRRGPVLIDIPMDVQMTPLAGEVPAMTSIRFHHPPGPSAAAVEKAAQMLRTAERPVILCGSGAFSDGAAEAVRAFAERLRIPVLVNGMARGLLPTESPVLLRRARKQALKRADLLIVLGAEFDFRLSYGQGPRFDPKVRVIQVAADGMSIGRNRSIDIGVVSDVRLFVEALAATAHARSYEAFLLELCEEEARRTQQLQALAQCDDTPIHPDRLAWELNAFLDRDTVLVADGGDIVARSAEILDVQRPGHWLDPGPFGCLGVGAPFAMAARIARPASRVVALFGDGAFGFNAFEYDSAARQKLPFVGVIGNDGAWGEMKTFHSLMFGTKNLVAQDLSQQTRYEDVVTALGGYGERVEHPKDIRPALERAAASELPSLVNVLLDPRIVRMPGTVVEAAAAVGGSG